MIRHNDPSPARILLVDNDPIAAQSLGQWLERAGHETVTARDPSEAMDKLGDSSDEPFSLAIVEVNVSARSPAAVGGRGAQKKEGADAAGMRLVKRIREHHESVGVITTSAYGTIESAVQAVKLGVLDYLTKPLGEDEIRLRVDRALRQQMLLTENCNLRSQLTQRYGLENMVGGDYQMQKIYEMVEAVAESDTTVLITGESGTGKSMVARAIHERSARRGGPLLTFACGSIPETLLESELFGHVKGAFTGAQTDKPGKLRGAEGGTLFIDEINSATPALQLKLLRVLQEKLFEPVGSHQPIRADVRFVLATNAHLSKMVREGAFREDLYYRINVVNIELPPLRQRTADVALLAEHFLQKHAERTGKMLTGLDQEVIEAFVRYRWPGNVRELENAVERAVVLTRHRTIRMADLPATIRNQSPDGEPGFVERRKNPWGWPPPNWKPTALRVAMEEPEKRVILAALKANGWNRQQTARVLEIDRTTLYKKIKRHGLEEAGIE